MSLVVAIDPGPECSGFVVWDTERALVLEPNGELPNEQLLERVKHHANAAVPAFGDRLAIEHVQCYGRSVGLPVLGTVFWEGRFYEAWKDRTSCPGILLPFRAVAEHHCHAASKVTEGNIRRAILDRFGDASARKGGLFQDVKTHAWSALALALAVADHIDTPATTTA